MTNVYPLVGPGRKIRQQRGRKTYDALLAVGFKLLEKREFESITIAELAKAAGYSVGAFYARFRSKDEFFEALVALHLQERSEARERILATEPRETLVPAVIDDLVKYYWRRRRFWRAALLRSANDRVFWAPINRHGREFLTRLLERIQSDVQRPLTPTERENIGFAAHMVLGMINNRIVNRPRPSLIRHSSFVANLTRAFSLVADYERLTSGDAAGVS